VPNIIKSADSNIRLKRTSFLISNLSERLPAMKFDNRAAIDPIKRAIPILSNPTWICSAIRGIKGSMVIIESPKRIKIK
jgi:hypothetical protein